MRAARTLRTKIYELSTDHGLDSGYFVAGTASWLSRSTREHTVSYEKRFIAPILMAPLSITPHPSSDDYELRLAGAARLNPPWCAKSNRNTILTWAPWTWRSWPIPCPALTPSP